ncbi:MAG: phosphoribosyltransferase [Actinomycetota bacterium]
MHIEPFKDRVDAGRQLAAALERFRGPKTLVLGVPRGGVVVAAEVARALGADLDVVIARKIGAPHQPELAIGAVVSGEDGRLLDEETLRVLRVSPEYVESETARQLAEIRRRIRDYRGDQPEPSLTGRTVLLVDDGIATGYTIRAALTALRRHHPQRLVAAAPVAPPDVPARLAEIADEVVCLRTPDPFVAVGAWYRDFTQVEDDEVRLLLASAQPPTARAARR